LDRRRTAFAAIEDALDDASIPSSLEAKGEGLSRLTRSYGARLASDSAYLIVGIIGPNNAGKSTLFTKLTGSDASPPAPDGGYTRHLTAAAHPDTLGSLREGGSLDALEIRTVAQEQQSGEGLQLSDSFLRLVSSPGTPRHLVLIDSPDFDSLERKNHEVSNRLAELADLLVAVVTRHTYNNARVRAVLSRAVAHGRPYMVVYNEAPDRETARRHAEVLCTGLGSPPLRRYFAPQDVTVQESPGALDVRSIDDEAPLELGTLTDPEVRSLLIRANASKLETLADRLQELTDDWQREQQTARRLVDRVESAATALGEKIAEACFPIEPLYEAVIAVLDRHSRTHREIRRPFTSAARLMIAAGRKLRAAFIRQASPNEHEAASRAVASAEREALAAAYPTFIQALDASGAASALAPSLSAELGPDRSLAIRQRIEVVLESTPISESYRERCEQAVAQALERRGSEEALQWLATSISASPAIGVGAFVALTGGLGGGDLVAAALAAATSPFLKRLVDLVGHGLVVEVRNEWVSERKALVANAALEAALPQSLPELRRVASAGEGADELRACVARLRELAENHRNA